MRLCMKPVCSGSRKAWHHDVGRIYAEYACLSLTQRLEMDVGKGLRCPFYLYRLPRWVLGRTPPSYCLHLWSRHQDSRSAVLVASTPTRRLESSGDWAVGLDTARILMCSIQSTFSIESFNNEMNLHNSWRTIGRTSWRILSLVYG